MTELSRTTLNTGSTWRFNALMTPLSAETKAKISAAMKKSKAAALG
jgi:hypothetical protein